MLILALSTSSARGSIALLHDQQLVAQRSYDDERRHAERIFGEMDAVLSEAEVERTQLDAIVCDVGPGSFTGTRVGLASAKGIALGLQVPLWPACALRAMALAAFSQSAMTANEIICCVDAKRGEIFHARYHRDGAELSAPTQGQKAAVAELLAQQTNTDVACCGEVLGKFDPTPNHYFADAACAMPDATWLARVAHQEFNAAEAPALALIEPIYVRGPDAIPNLPKPPVMMS